MNTEGDAAMEISGRMMSDHVDKIYNYIKSTNDNLDDFPHEELENVRKRIDDYFISLLERERSTTQLMPIPEDENELEFFHKINLATERCNQLCKAMENADEQLEKIRENINDFHEAITKRRSTKKIKIAEK